MIKSITAVNPNNERLKMELTNPESSGLIVKKVRGLGPPKAQISSTEMATLDGDIFNGARVEKRNIVLTLQMMFAPTIEDSRQKTYRYFPIKKKITLIVETDNRIAEISGYVESNEPDIFSKEETAQISIICTDPYFYALGDSETVFSGVQPLFEFPFENEDLVEPTLEFGSILLDTRATLDYIGDVDTGVTITIHALGPAENIRIYNADTYEEMVIDTWKIYNLTGHIFDTNDDIIISTVRGSKTIRLLRGGVYTNIIAALKRGSSWFQISSGPNKFGFTAQSGENNLMISFTYRNAYGGI